MPHISTFPLPRTHWTMEGRQTLERLWKKNVEHGRNALSMDAFARLSQANKGRRSVVTNTFADELVKDLGRGLSVASCLHRLGNEGWANLPKQRTVHYHLKEGVIVLPKGKLRYCPRKTKRRHIPMRAKVLPERTSIEDRPPEINGRERMGDWEMRPPRAPRDGARRRLRLRLLRERHRRADQRSPPLLVGQRYRLLPRQLATNRQCPTPRQQHLPNRHPERTYLLWSYFGSILTPWLILLANRPAPRPAWSIGGRSKEDQPPTLGGSAAKSRRGSRRRREDRRRTLLEVEGQRPAIPGEKSLLLA